ncbi:7277_t:CDS:2 [Entrophospora sp. SA101]|nr:7277_t:CDS:2 [Entrophospora sp. SA101]CAJ0844547.1 8440_t:CDS:2 [Entrophospora sp. SA101]CAJ0855278.1 11636_t:CDS:2 [Entrophospora sp. SA101]
MLTVISEPKLTTRKFYNFRCSENTRAVEDFFKVIPASEWSLEAYTNYILEQPDVTINFEQVFINFTESLDQIHQLFVVPLSIRTVCQKYIDWLKTLTGRYVIEACRKFFDAKILLKKKVSMKAVVEETINLTSHTEAYQSYLQPSILSNIEPLPFEYEIPSSQSSPGSPSIIRTPNKRPFENPEVKKYCQDSTIVCAFGMKPKDLEAEIGKELVQEVLSTHKVNPLLWTSKFEEYIDNILKKSGDEFEKALQKNVDTGDELFHLYCKKILIDFYHLVDINQSMSRKISERKYITYNIASLFKFYETTFGTRLSDDQEVWQMEVAGPPWHPTTTHTINDTKKTFRSDILNLVSILQNNLDCDIDLAIKIKVFCTQAIGTRLTLYALNILPDGRFLATELISAVVPFSWSGRSKYKAILQMMSIFHDELTKQEELMEKISLCSSSTNEITVRQVLKLPAEMFKRV